MRQSWLDIPAGTDFSLHNLPLGVFRTAHLRPRLGIAIGDHILDLAALACRGLLSAGGSRLPAPEVPLETLEQDRLNAFLALGRPVWSTVRARVRELLDPECPDLRDDGEARQRIVVPMRSATMELPVDAGDYVDFYSSVDHATNVGTMFRGKENALPPNWKHLPIGYHGRSSSLIATGVDVPRPLGQTRPDPEAPPVFGPSRALDFELEMGAVIGRGSALGQRVSTEEAEDHVFGMVLVNDWSARDIQKWEYVPLGPFLGKSFATSVSPWVVPMEALEPFRVAGPEQDVEVLPYLRTEGEHAFDLTLDVLLQPAGSSEPVRICRSNSRYLYWSVAQQIAHLTSNGTNMRVGDLYASGTISGPGRDERGCLLEISWGGAEPLTLPDGSRRKYLDDGDTVIFRGFGERGDVRVGFGELRATVLPTTGF